MLNRTIRNVLVFTLVVILSGWIGVFVDSNRDWLHVQLD